MKAIKASAVLAVGVVAFSLTPAFALARIAQVHLGAVVELACIQYV